MTEKKIEVLSQTKSTVEIAELMIGVGDWLQKEKGCNIVDIYVIAKHLMEGIEEYQKEHGNVILEVNKDAKPNTENPN